MRLAVNEARARDMFGPTAIWDVAVDYSAARSTAAKQLLEEYAGRCGGGGICSVLAAAKVHCLDLPHLPVLHRGPSSQLKLPQCSHKW